MMNFLKIYYTIAVRRTLLFAAIVILAIPGVFAQGKPNEKEIKEKLAEANYYFEYDNFHLALPVFEQIYKLDSSLKEVNYKLGVCLFSIKRDKTPAIPYLEYAKTDFKESYYYLGRIYHSQQLLNNAIDNFRAYKDWYADKLHKNDEIDYYIDKAETAKQMMMKKTGDFVINLGHPINSKYPEYAPLISADGTVMIFTSRREGSTGGLLDPLGEYYEDIYISHNTEGKWTEPLNIGAPVNTSSHDASVSLSADGQQLYIYRTNRDLEGGDIYLSKRTGETWSAPEKITGEINYKDAWNPSGSISQDDGVFYFSSNRPGGYGGKDIYKVQKLPDGQWSKSVNLGPVINTPYDEDAPFIHPDGITLYFSSKGHKNMGDYDIFKSELNDDSTWSSPENLGYPVNSVNDDIYFVVSADDKHGFFSSNRAGAAGGTDIYMADISNNIVNYIVIRGMITTNEPVFTVLKATVTLLDYDTKEVQGIYRTNKVTGKYVMVLLPRKKYKMVVESKGYYSYTGEIDLTEKLKPEDLFKSISLKMEQK